MISCRLHFGCLIGRVHCCLENLEVSVNRCVALCRWVEFFKRRSRLDWVYKYRNLGVFRCWMAHPVDPVDGFLGYFVYSMNTITSILYADWTRAGARYFIIFDANVFVLKLRVVYSL